LFYGVTRARALQPADVARVLIERQGKISIELKISNEKESKLINLHVLRLPCDQILI